ncbi:MAG: PilZ domain-containing protein [Blastocatellia bacterium]|nr:PilZ domain-containing protein [Blastocatellia bacterium]
MASDPTENQMDPHDSEAQATRREKRIPCRLSAMIEGIAKDGDFLHEEAECISISRKGCRVISKMQVEVGDQVAILVPSINPERRELMNVVWVREVDGERHIGLGPVDEETHMLFGEEVPA